jgi:hypothetical protein
VTATKNTNPAGNPVFKVQQAVGIGSPDPDLPPDQQSAPNSGDLFADLTRAVERAAERRNDIPPPPDPAA